MSIELESTLPDLLDPTPLTPARFSIDDYLEQQGDLTAVEKFAQDLIAVKDSLELGIQNSAKADVASLIEGQNATLRLLAKAFEKAQIEEINPEGAAFNPEQHEAMMAQPSDAAPNTVLAVIQRGYQLNGRLLRPARVVVSAAKS
jgi:molecular chaperone GrpE